MSEDEIPKRKRPWGAYALMGIADIAFTIVLGFNVGGEKVFPTTLLAVLGMQLAVGLALIAFGGESRSAGKVMVYGLVAAVAIVLGLALLIFAVCTM